MIMQIRLTLALLALSACPALAAMTADMYLSDGNTPLALRDPNLSHVYRDIMVGTKLCVIVSSEKNTRSTGKIFMSWVDSEKGELAARDFDELTGEWKGSCLPAAGTNAYVSYSADAFVTGFALMAAGAWRTIGRWFIFDYRAKAAGTCSVVLRDSTKVSSNDPADPGAVVTTLTLNHVPSRDFNGDTIVNFRDFALLAGQWRTKADPDPNGFTGPFDLDGDGYVGISDLALFSKFWLDRTDIRVAVPDPNTSSSPPPL